MLPLPETIVGKTCENRPVRWAAIQEAVVEIREGIKLKTTTGACSAGLIYQLAGHYCRMPQSFGKHALLVDVHAVLDQIGEMEKAPFTRATPTKPARPFTAGALKGLWHKHWFQASFLFTNLLRETDSHGDMLILRHLDAEFGRDRWSGEIITEKLVRKLVCSMFYGALTHRSGGAAYKRSRFTGEWIVFAKANGRNIYLTLAGHDETNDAIFSRCSVAFNEFPELASLPS